MVETGNSDNKRENINDHLGNIEVMERQFTLHLKDFYGKGNVGRSQFATTSGTLGKIGESGLRILKGKRKRKN